MIRFEIQILFKSYYIHNQSWQQYSKMWSSSPTECWAYRQKDSIIISAPTSCSSPTTSKDNQELRLSGQANSRPNTSSTTASMKALWAPTSPTRRQKMERRFLANQTSLIKQKSSLSNAFRSLTIYGSTLQSKTLSWKRMDSNLASRPNSTKPKKTKSPSANRSQLPKSEATTIFTIIGLVTIRSKSTLSFCRVYQSTQMMRLRLWAQHPNRMVSQPQLRRKLHSSIFDFHILLSLSHSSLLLLFSKNRFSII